VVGVGDDEQLPVDDDGLPAPDVTGSHV
jgi:hypothetical protein